MQQSYDENNIFAKLIRGEIPSIRVYEDDDVIAFMDVMPQGKGHTLIVPRKGSRNLLDAEPETLAKAVKKAFNADGVTVMQFNEPASGQTVFHLHFHVIPRFENVPLKPHSGEPVDTKTLEESAAKIRAAL